MLTPGGSSSRHTAFVGAHPGPPAARRLCQAEPSPPARLSARALPRSLRLDGPSSARTSRGGMSMLGRDEKSAGADKQARSVQCLYALGGVPCGPERREMKRIPADAVYGRTHERLGGVYL